MEIRQIKYFLSLCNNKNYTKAAEELFITQPTLSQQISSLENNVGLKLIDHSKKVFKLTEDGEAFVPLAEKFLTHYENFEREIENYKRSLNYTLSYASLNAVHAGITPDLFDAFQKNHPNIHIIHSTTVFSNLVSFVKDKLVDISMAMTFTNKEYEGIKKIVLDEYNDQLVIIVPKNSIYSSITNWNDPLMDELLTKKVYLFDGWKDYDPPISVLKKYNKSLKSFIYYDNLIEFLSRPYSWDGFTMIPELHLDFTQASALFHKIRFPHNECSLDVSLLYNPTNTNPAIKSFINELPENIIFPISNKNK